MDPEVMGSEPAEPTIVPEVADEPTDLDALAVEDNQQAETEAPEDDDSEEFEWNGKQVRGPKGLKDGVLMHADYTKKTQEVSNHRKELEAFQQRLSQQAKATDDELQARAQLFHVDAELNRFADYDWNAYQAHYEQDPMGADKAWNYKAHLAAQRQEIGKQVSEFGNARSAEAQQETAKRMHETEQYARSKGWTAETDKQVIDFALSKGATKETLGQMMSPLVYEMINLARLGQQLLDKPATQKPAPQTQPLKVVAAKANPPARSRPEEIDDMEQYVAARKKQGYGG